MKQFHAQLEKKAATVKLTAAERRDVKDRLLTYMEYHPLPAELKTAKRAAPSTSLRTEPFALIQFPFGLFLKSSAVAAAIVLLVVPFVAERAMPGDTLYAVKVQFNEEVRSTLTFDSYQKVAWETERLNRRIAEARLLATEGRLTEEVEAEMAAAVKEHTVTAQKEIEALRTVDADDATIAALELDSTLETQSSTLKIDDERNDVNTTDKKQVSLIATAIDESRVQQVSSTTPPAFDKLIARVEQNTTRLFELRDAIASRVAEDKLAEVDRRIEDIERTVAEAVALDETDETIARQQLVEVLQRSQRLIVFMTELEVLGTVDIETVVPVIPTADEKVAKQRELLQLLTAKRGSIVAAIEVEKNKNIVAKADVALVEINNALEDLASSTAYLAYVERAASAITLADDTLRLFTQVVPTTVPESPAATSSVETASTSTPVVDTASSTPVDVGSSTTQPTTSIDTIR